MKIVEAYLDKGHINRPGTALECTESYVFHYTANESPTADAMANRNWFNRKFQLGKYKETKNGQTIVKDGYIEYGSAGAAGIGQKFRYGSTQAIADMNGVVLSIPLTEKAHACGDNTTPLAQRIFGGRQNNMTINIEITNNDVIKGSDADWVGACNNAIEFVAQDIVNRNKSFDYKKPHAFLRHYDVSGKLCPAPFVDLSIAAPDPDWIAFKEKLIKRIEELKGIGVATNIPAPEPIHKSGSKYFTDIPDGHWAGPIIDKAKEYEIIQGIAPGILGFTEEFARIITMQISTINMIERKVGKLNS